MATREENIKKINDELEKLDDEQLEQIAGGKFDWRSCSVDVTNQENQKQNPANVVASRYLS